MRTSILVSMTCLALARPAAAETVDLDFSLWLDGRWVCGGLFPVDTGEETDLCEIRHRGKNVRLRAELNPTENEQFEVHGRVIDVGAESSKDIDRHKFAVFTLNNEPADISGNDKGRETFRFKAEIVH